MMLFNTIKYFYFLDLTTFRRLGKKNVKNFMVFWGMRRQDYLLLRFTDL